MQSSDEQDENESDDKDPGDGPPFDVGCRESWGLYRLAEFIEFSYS